MIGLEWHMQSYSEPGSLFSLRNGKASISQGPPYAGSYGSRQSTLLSPVQSLQSGEWKRGKGHDNVWGFKLSVWFEVWTRRLMA